MHSGLYILCILILNETCIHEVVVHLAFTKAAVYGCHCQCVMCMMFVLAPVYRMFQKKKTLIVVFINITAVAEDL